MASIGNFEALLERIAQGTATFSELQPSLTFERSLAEWGKLYELDLISKEVFDEGLHIPDGVDRNIVWKMAKHCYQTLDGGASKDSVRAEVDPKDYGVDSAAVFDSGSGMILINAYDSKKNEKYVLKLAQTDQFFDEVSAYLSKNGSVCLVDRFFRCVRT